MIHTHRLELFACRASENFAKQVIDHLNQIKSPEEPEVHLGELEVTPFSDGEFQPQYAESVRGASVYILQSTIPPADNLMEMLLAIDAAKRANVYARELMCPVIICHKTRERANVVGSITAIGEIEGKDIIIVDDMIDTAGTLCKAAEVLMQRGASSVRACATHGLLSGGAIERIHDSALQEVFITDTIPHPELVDDPKIRIVSMTEVFASIIYKVYNYESISPDFVH